MATRKGAAKGAAKGTKRSAGKKAGASKKGGERGILSWVLGKLIPGKGPHPLYGMPIDNAIASGNIAEMRRLLPRAQKYQREVEAALVRLEQRIRKG